MNDTYLTVMLYIDSDILDERRNDFINKFLNLCHSKQYSQEKCYQVFWN